MTSESAFRFPRSFASVWALLRKGLRFGFIGIISSGIYAVVMMLCVSLFSLDAKLASGIGYLASLPFNFVAHRHYTFVAKGLVRSEILRFIAVHAVNIGLAVGAIALTVDGLGLNYEFGMVATLVLVPAVTFVMMNLWVFSDQKT